MKSLHGFALSLVTLLTVNALHAQTNQAYWPAIEETSPLPASELPFIGTYYSAANPTFGPAPANMYGLSGWVLDSTNGIFLQDDLPGAPTGGYAMDDSDTLLPEGDSDTNIVITSFVDTAYIPTNGLYLAITNISEGTVCANLYNGTDTVYEIFSTTTNLSAVRAVTNWTIESEVFPCDNTNIMSFTVPQNGRNPLFLWARDWTGITNNGNQTPEWWFYRWFGLAGLKLSDTNLDPADDTFLYDYIHGYDPNLIQFTLDFTNTYFTTTNIGAYIDNLAGMPFYEAVLINDTNTSDAIWESYTGTNIFLSLASNGLYSVIVGLRGLPLDALETWSTPQQIVVDVSTPVLIITSFGSNTVSQPLIQLQGLVSENLANLTYDVSNVLGVITNQQGYWNASFFATNALNFTTNCFQCYDISLANGLNTIVLHATDLEGNTATLATNFTLDYSIKTNPPLLSILWPQNGTTISGSNFTAQAQVDDDTATVTAQITDGNGDVNIEQGLVERSGLVWVNNLPLAAETNTLAVTATDAAGNSVTTNLTLVQSSIQLTMNPLSSDQYNQASVNVSGTVSDTNATITINGTNAYPLDEEGDWEADNVPVNPTGVATLDAEIYNSDGTKEGSQTFDLSQPPIVSLMSYTANVQSNGKDTGDCADGGSDEVVNWVFYSGGLDTTTHWGVDGDCHPNNRVIADNLSGGLYGYEPTWENHYIVDNYVYDYMYASWDTSQYSSSVNTHVMVNSSGPTATGQKALFLVSAQVFNEEASDPPEQVPGSALHFVNQVPGTAVIDVTNGDSTVMSQFLAIGPAGTNFEVSPQTSVPNVSFNPPWPTTNITLQILDANTGSNLMNQINDVIVGQQINLTCQLNVTNALLNNSMLTNFQWTVPGYAISNYVVTSDASSATVVTNFPLSNTNALFYWVDGSSSRTVQCSALVDGATVTGQAVFNVIRPNADWIGQITGTVTVDTNYFPGTNFFAGANRPADLTWIHLGNVLNSDGQSITGGITFTATNVNLNGYSGTNNALFCVQVINYIQVEHCMTNGISQHVNFTGLDGRYPYADLTKAFLYYDGNATSTDAPAAPCRANDDYVTDADSFQMYLMFQAKNIPSIPVPLKVIAWNWSGAANYAPPWNLVLSNATISVNNSGVEAFPQWTDSVTNFVLFTNSICN